MDSLQSYDVLITGGLGFTGSNLSSRLVDMGANVTILDIVRSEEKLHSIKNIRDQVEVVDADIRDSEAVEAAVTGQDIVYHLASKTSRLAANENPLGNLEINCGGSLNVLESAAACED
ncbi:NAD-dependent epimerase/dehydratase family protein, partial [Actinoplanes cyaneus]|uniref:NAD-dependent epimerase/dehydratase family protein n=1 Tax=Actinoplanes cyaneus TaxID=52696 RepID=UPI0031CFB4A6